MTEQPYEGATAAELENPLVQELLAVHGMFRRQLAAILGYANEVLAGRAALGGPETSQQVAQLVRAGAQYATYLHHHHHLESSMLFPALAREGLAPTVHDRLEREHAEIAVLIEQFRGAVDGLAAREPAALHSDLRRLAALLEAHLAYEETHVCPMLARMRGWPF